VSDFVIGIDLGGTNLKTAILSRDKQLLAKESRPTNAGAGPDAVIDAMEASAREVAAAAGASLDLGTPDWRDGFESNLHYWYLAADENVEFAIAEGSLVLTAFRPAGDNWRVAELRELSDFYLEAKVTFGETCSGKDSFGFLVRAPDSEESNIASGYAFAFSCDGNFRYYLMRNGEYVGLENWQTTASLNAGPNQTNQVGVWAEGDQFRVYINGERVAEFSDGTYSRGLFGLLIRSAETDNFSVAVDEIAYWTLP